MTSGVSSTVTSSALLAANPVAVPSRIDIQNTPTGVFAADGVFFHLPFRASVVRGDQAVSFVGGDPSVHALS